MGCFSFSGGGGFAMTSGKDRPSYDPRQSNGAARRAVRKWLCDQRLPCAICGQPIDYSLPAGDPWSFECDEIVPVSLGGSPFDRDNVQATHRICNQKRGNKTMAELRGQGSRSLSVRRSGRW